jgi:hypothetical protein
MNRSTSRAPAGNESIKEENQNGADNGTNEAGGFADSIKAQKMSQVRSNEGTGEAEEDCQNATARVLSWCKQLCDGADQQADNDRGDDPHAR